MSALVPGSKEDRGIVGFNQVVWQESKDTTGHKDPYEIYQLPLIGRFLDKIACTRYIPICPSYKARECNCCCRKKKRDEENADEDSVL